MLVWVEIWLGCRLAAPRPYGWEPESVRRIRMFGNLCVWILPFCQHENAEFHWTSSHRKFTIEHREGYIRLGIINVTPTYALIYATFVYPVGRARRWNETMRQRRTEKRVRFEHLTKWIMNSPRLTGYNFSFKWIFCLFAFPRSGALSPAESRNWKFKLSSLSFVFTSLRCDRDNCGEREGESSGSVATLESHRE